MANREVDPHLRVDDEHWIPPVTTPQGTQEYAVPPGEPAYEGRDVNPKALFAWFSGLLLALVLILGIIAGAFAALEQQDKAIKDAVPSDLFARQTVPPLPRLIPNPFDNASSPANQGPVEYGQEQRRLETEALKRLQLADQNGQPVLPETVVLELVRSQGRSTGAGTTAGDETSEAAGVPAPAAGGLVSGQRPPDGVGGIPAVGGAGAGPRPRVDARYYESPSDSSGGLLEENRLD